MTRAEYDALADRVEREGVTPEMNEAIAIALGWVDTQAIFDPWRHPQFGENGGWACPNFTNLQVVADHTPDGWIWSVMAENWDGSWRATLLTRGHGAAKSKNTLTEAAARIAAILRAKGAEADAVSR